MAEELVRLLPQDMTRVGFFDPYLDVLGGGEKYLLTILEMAVRVPGMEVTLLSPNPPDTTAWARLNLHVAPDAFRWRRATALTVTGHTRGLDLFVALANHVPPLTLARRSAAVLQFPFADLRDPAPLPSVFSSARALDRRLRLRRYEPVLCYSDFVRRALIERLRISDPVVVAPPVDLPAARPHAKQRSIIAVGRFFPAADGNNKKHDVLIDAFRELRRTGAADGWMLHLAGGCHSDSGSQAYLAALRERAADLPVAFHANVAAEELGRLYDESALFWHAAGHGESRPERHEHFGITTVEAMAHGCVPVVPALGGQLEIVEDGENGYVWRDLDELVTRTAALIAAPERRAALCEAGARDARRYDKSRFVERISALLLDPLTSR